MSDTAGETNKKKGPAGFIQKLEEEGIDALPVEIVGGVLYLVTLVFYILAFVQTRDQADQFVFEEPLWIAVLTLHAIEFVLVAVETYYFSGRKWWWQALVMSCAGIITGLVATLFVVALVRHGYNVGFGQQYSLTTDLRVLYTGVSILIGLAGDAVLLSTLFAYFHLRLERLHPLISARAGTNVQVRERARRTYIGYSPLAGARYMYTK